MTTIALQPRMSIQQPEKRIQFNIDDERSTDGHGKQRCSLKRVQIHVQSASDIPLVGTSRTPPNAYIRIRIGTKARFRTQQAKRSQHPTWHENSPAVEVNTDARVNVKLMHRTLWPGGDVLLAEGDWSLEDIMRRQEVCDKDHMFEIPMTSRVEGFSPCLTIGIRELASERAVPSLITEARKRAEAYSLTLKDDPSKGSMIASDGESSPSTSSSGLSETDSARGAQ